MASIYTEFTEAEKASTNPVLKEQTVVVRENKQSRDASRRRCAWTISLWLYVHVYKPYTYFSEQEAPSLDAINARCMAENW